MTIHKLKQGVEWRQIEGEVIAADLHRGKYIGINASGALLWPLLDAGTSTQALVAELLDVYDVSEDVARSEVSAWLAWLRQHELLAS